MTQARQYIWQKSCWPKFTLDASVVLEPLGECRRRQGALLSRMSDLETETFRRARAEVLIEEVVKTSEIEGEHLNPVSVRSSVSRRLGIELSGADIRDAQSEAVVSILMDAVENRERALKDEILFGWHAALFPTGYSGFHRISVAAYRDDAEGPMRVVSGPVGREKIHYEAPPAGRVGGEMAQFIQWWERSRGGTDGIVRAAMAHFWFVAIHPFDDGNGRLARALTEMALAQDEKLSTRLYSLSSAIMADRLSYYDILERTVLAEGDLTPWILWFVDHMTQAMDRSDVLLSNVLFKSRFWRHHLDVNLNARQRKVINRLLDAEPDGFEGGMTNGKYAGIAHVSRATAARELSDLVNKGVLCVNAGRGRSTSYRLCLEAPTLARTQPFAESSDAS